MRGEDVGSVWLPEAGEVAKGPVLNLLKNPFSSFVLSFYLISFHLETGYGFHTVPHIPYVVLLELPLQLPPVYLFSLSLTLNSLCTLFSNSLSPSLNAFLLLV